MKSLLLFCSLLLSLSVLQAQQMPEIPDEIELTTTQDFAKIQPLVEEVANWLIQSPLDKDSDQRKKANAFLWKWISGTPEFTVDISDAVTKLYNRNVQLLNIFLAGYARNYTQNPAAYTDQAAYRAGIYAMMDVYKRGIAIKKNKEMEKLIHLPAAEQEAYIQKKFP